MYSIRPTGEFGKNISDLVKSHYKKNPTQEAAFQDVLRNFMSRLMDNPKIPVDGPISFAKDNASRAEPWPKCFPAVPGYELWKYRFHMPGLRGKAKCGRVIYLVRTATQEIYPLLAYTHAEYPDRPADGYLKRTIQAAVGQGKTPTGDLRA